MSPFIPPGAARPVASAGGLTQARPGCVPHIAFHSTGGREAGGLGGWPDTGATRLCSSYRLSFHRRARGRGAPRGGLKKGGPAGVPPFPFFSTGGARGGGAAGGGITKAARAGGGAGWRRGEGR